jgi:aspartate/methionine/tyrosine aminotransferase
MVTRASKRYVRLETPTWRIWESIEMNRQAEMKKRGKEPLAITHSDPVKYGFANQEISKYLVEATEKGLHGYPHTIEYNELKKAICGFEKKYRDVDYEINDIILSQGVSGALMVLHYSVLDQGALDEVVVINPSHYAWTPRNVVEALGAKMIFVPQSEENDWKPDLEALRKSITKRTKYITVSVNNPSGTAYNEKTCKKIVDIAGENDVMIVSDEMYGMITYDDIDFPSMAKVAGDVPIIVVNGMSKFFMRTGWRIGYCAIHDPEGKISEVKHAANMYNSLYGHNACRIRPIIYAATKAYKDPLEGSFNFIKNLHPLRDYAMKRLSEMEGISCVRPKSAFYVFPHVHGIGKIWKTDEEFMTELNKEEALIFCLGNPFGPKGFGHFRGMITPNLEMQEEIWNRLERFLKRHQVS